jgi:hypothetical protein
MDRHQPQEEWVGKAYAPPFMKKHYQYKKFYCVYILLRNKDLKQINDTALQHIEP